MFGKLFSNIGEVSDAGTRTIVTVAVKGADVVDAAGDGLVDVARQAAVSARSELKSSVMQSLVDTRELCIKHDVTEAQLDAEMEKMFPTKKAVAVPLTVKQLQQQVTAARKAAKAAEAAAQQ